MWLTLGEKNFEAAREIFEYLAENFDGDPDAEARIFANIAYAMIGLNNYDDAIQALNHTRELRGDDKFYAYHRIALAYCFHMKGNIDDSEKLIDEAKYRPEYAPVKDDLKEYYLEIANKL